MRYLPNWSIVESSPPFSLAIYEKAINDIETTENQKIKGEIADCKKELIRIEEVGQTEKKCSC